MIKTLILFVLVFSTAIYSNVFGQQAAPPGAGDKDLRDNNVKSRSVELERIDREANKPNKTGNSGSSSNASGEDKLAAKYGEIKEDFEQIQMSQDVIIKTYQNTSKIDYAQIIKSALEINKSARRLDLNLFPSKINEDPESEKNDKNEKKQSAETKLAKSLRDLIVDLDNAIGSFASSTMFQNLRLIDPKVSIKTRTDLAKIIESSAELSAQAQKSASAGN